MMSKNGLSVLTAGCLCAASLALMGGRWWVLGDEIDGPPGHSTWKVTLVVKGDLRGKDAVLTMVLPPDFRRQHISDEVFESNQLRNSSRKAKGSRPRQT